MSTTDLQNQPNQSSTQRTYLKLRNEIITGKLVPGERLKVETLKDSYGTGASPIREALSLLTSDQLVERLDQRGFRVAQTSRKQFGEILDLRCTLDDKALRQSVQNGGRDWEENLVLVHHYLSRTDRSDAEVFEERHKRFHMALLEACESPILLRFCSQLYDLNVRYRFLAGRSKSYSSRDVEAEHLAILDAAVSRDVEATSAYLMAHYRNTGGFLAELMDAPAKTGT
ncbi:GntR family transcriptional regulator [Oceanomicrobium pacificus]|uniref:FCD domain-containing protein n=1 Tax=Oceanomicrobium pacificus TaxID=2692916 RepID=A0A6B0U240_9RHOB|nr:FCD domain-containing protein [Oceanomicrobium pacificus]MXU65101.1 FCD domain-containing protein [Oceanomicrobium pacificus]